MRKALLVLALLGLATAAYALPPPIIYWADGFNYPNGPLNGNDGWAGSAGIEIGVTGQVVRVMGGGFGSEANRAFSPAYNPAPSPIVFHFNIMAGNGGNTLWGVWVDDPLGRNMARWYGTGVGARPRIDGTGSVLNPVNLSGPGIWDDLDVKITPATNLSEFFFNGTSLGSLSYAVTGANGTVGQVKIDRVYNSTSDQYVYLDNMALGTVPEPSSLVALAMFGLGALGLIRRRT